MSGRSGQEELVRAIAESAYRRGARYVDLSWFDPHLKLARLRHAPEDTLDWVPPWLGERATALGQMAAALIALTGPTAPGPLRRRGPGPGRPRPPAIGARGDRGHHGGRGQLDRGALPQPGLGAPSSTPTSLPTPRLERLWQQIAHVCRLDEPDPAAAWRARGEELEASARRLDALRLSRPAVRRPGHRPDGRAAARRRAGSAAATTAATACPTCRTSPPRRCSPPPTPSAPRASSPPPGRSTWAARWCAASGPLRGRPGGRDRRRRRAPTSCARGPRLDDGAARLGEVALVDGSGRIGPLGTVFYDTLLDENAASHIAFGAGYPGRRRRRPAPRGSTERRSTSTS